MRGGVTGNKSVKCGLFRRREQHFVESEVLIEPGHPKTKIWLLEVPAAEVLSFCLGTPLSLRTLYRYGCWRRHHLIGLSRLRLRMF
jgi:hypothetical protein